METFIAEECCAILKCSMNKLYDLINEGRLPAAKFGRRWVITEDNLNEFIRGETKVCQENIQEVQREKAANSAFLEEIIYEKIGGKLQPRSLEDLKEKMKERGYKTI